jgi:hypothetical protein
MLNKFHDWLEGAKRGAKFTYHTGDLAFDRYVPLAKTPTPEKRELNMLADMAYELYLQSEILLIQQRQEKNIYKYIAVKR